MIEGLTEREGLIRGAVDGDGQMDSIANRQMMVGKRRKRHMEL